MCEQYLTRLIIVGAILVNKQPYRSHLFLFFFFFLFGLSMSLSLLFSSLLSFVLNVHPNLRLVLDNRHSNDNQEAQWEDDNNCNQN